ARGRRLTTPSGRDTRPTSDRVREAMFTSLEAMSGGLARLAVLDLYAGSGAIGLEALSRGARRVLLVENDRRAVRAIQRNLAVLGDLEGARLQQASVGRLTKEPPPDRQPFDVVILDPPYALPQAAVGAVLTDLAANGWLAEDAIVVVERATRDGDFVWPGGFEAEKERRYGDTTVWYGRWAAETRDRAAETRDRAANRERGGPDSDERT
ncbi:MAG TPA: 16S rRNA (guanine(966)-N(2))-methyltransferase RsmD, partial [Actinopolymorphaceae bacterium]